MRGLQTGLASPRGCGLCLFHPRPNIPVGQSRVAWYSHCKRLPTVVALSLVNVVENRQLDEIAIQTSLS